MTALAAAAELTTIDGRPSASLASRAWAAGSATMSGLSAAEPCGAISLVMPSFPPAAGALPGPVRPGDAGHVLSSGATSRYMRTIAYSTIIGYWHRRKPSRHSPGRVGRNAVAPPGTCLAPRSRRPPVCVGDGWSDTGTPVVGQGAMREPRGSHVGAAREAHWENSVASPERWHQTDGAIPTIDKTNETIG